MKPVVMIILESKRRCEAVGRWPQKREEVPTVGTRVGKLTCGPTTAGTQESAVLTHLDWRVRATSARSFKTCCLVRTVLKFPRFVNRVAFSQCQPAPAPLSTS